MADTITKLTKQFTGKMKEPHMLYLITTDTGNEYLVKNSVKRKITSTTSTKDMETMKNIFSVFAVQVDADKIPSGPDL